MVWTAGQGFGVARSNLTNLGYKHFLEKMNFPMSNLKNTLISHWVRRHWNREFVIRVDLYMRSGPKYPARPADDANCEVTRVCNTEYPLSLPGLPIKHVLFVTHY